MEMVLVHFFFVSARGRPDVLEKHYGAEVCGVGGSLGCRRACDA
jgi:hypothetical protein